MNNETVSMLVKKANEAREKSYCPYSGFAVGAALLCSDGTIYTGANIENTFRLCVLQLMKHPRKNTRGVVDCEVSNYTSGFIVGSKRNRLKQGANRAEACVGDRSRLCDGEGAHYKSGQLIIPQASQWGFYTVL